MTMTQVIFEDKPNGCDVRIGWSEGGNATAREKQEAAALAVAIREGFNAMAKKGKTDGLHTAP